MLKEEMIAKAKEAKSVEELLALAKANNVELTEEEAKAYFAQLNPKSGALDDDELDAVAGGGCETTVDGKKYTVVTNGCKCFTGQYLCNVGVTIGNLGKTYFELTIRTDNEGLRKFWLTDKQGVCGSCAHLGFKDGLGYCEKS